MLDVVKNKEWLIDRLEMMKIKQGLEIQQLAQHKDFNKDYYVVCAKVDQKMFIVGFGFFEICVQIPVDYVIPHKTEEMNEIAMEKMRLYASTCQLIEHLKE